ncbi:MAG: diacylglycerol kinase family lipid kinase [Planctomycetes bacterium]|nr:diacylglycerol kinase family lipid kinase [Planctomycetota bacterium]
MAQDGSMLIVVNPAADRGRGLRKAEAVASLLQQRGVRATIHHTTGSGDAGVATRRACLNRDLRPGCVVACGGDGTIQEVADALASLRAELGTACPRLGLAPAGRCNDFARALGVTPDPRMITETLCNGAARPIDLGRVNGRYFCTVVTVGVDADISSYVDGMKMPLKGTIAYLYGTLRVLGRYRGRALRIEGDFGVIEHSVFVASTANTSSYGGAIRIAPEAVPDDGLLDLCVIDHVSKRRMVTLLPKVVRGRHSQEPEVRFVKTRKLHIDALEVTELWADGERIARTPATIEVAPAAVRIIMPAGWNEHTPC